MLQSQVFDQVGFPDLLVARDFLHESVSLLLLHDHAHRLQLAQVLLVAVHLEADLVDLVNVLDVEDCEAFLELIGELLHVLLVAMRKNDSGDLVVLARS